MSRRVTFVLLVAAALAVTVPAHGGSPTEPEETVLGEYTLSSVFGFFGVATSVTHTTYLSPEPGVFTGQGTLFENILLEDGYSQTVEVTYGDDPDFDLYVQLITDGQDWYIYDTLTFSDGTLNAHFGLESERLPIGNLPPPDDTSTYPDLFGYEITRVVRELTLSMASPGSDPNGDGIWTDVQIDVVTTIYGIPAPGAGAILALAAFASRRRRTG